MAGINVGTSGWSYPKGEGTWNGYFYPAGKKIDELAYYSQYLSTVEINNTFYRPPEPEMAQAWAHRVLDGFLFAVKLWQKFTHPKMFEKATGETADISLKIWILSGGVLSLSPEQARWGRFSLNSRPAS